eukprot:gene15010-biopygen10067
MMVSCHATMMPQVEEDGRGQASPGDGVPSARAGERGSRRGFRHGVQHGFPHSAIPNRASSEGPVRPSRAAGKGAHRAARRPRPFPVWADQQNIAFKHCFCMV